MQLSKSGALGRLVDSLDEKEAELARQRRDRRTLSADPLAAWSEQLRSDDNVVRAEAARALSEMGAIGISVLVKALDDPDKDVRSSAAIAFGVIKPLPAEAVKALTALVDDPEREVRQMAAFTIGAVGRFAKSAIKPLIRRLRDEEEHEFVRRGSAEALANIVAHRPTTAALIDALSDSDSDIRIAATYALGWMKEGKSNALAHIERLKSSPDCTEAALWALKRIE